MFYLRVKWVKADDRWYRLTSFRLFGVEVYSSQVEVSPITLQNCEPKKLEVPASTAVTL